MTDSRLDRRRLDELRKDILALAHAQARLRELLKQYVAKEQCSLNTVALKVGAGWAAISELIEGKRVIVKDTVLENLAQLMGLDASEADEIVALGSKVPHRYLGLALCTDAVINIVFDILVAHNAVASQYTMTDFARGFAQHEQTVLDALNLGRDALEVLQSTPGVVDDIFEMLVDDTLEQKVQQAKAARTKKREEAAARIGHLVSELLPRYPDKVSLVGDLGLSRGSLDPAKLQGASLAQLAKFVSVLEAAVETTVPVETNTEQLVSEPVQVLPHPAFAEKDASPADPFGGLAGETIQGVPHVLTAENFREIEGVSAAAVVAALDTSVQMTTGLLALVAQLKGDEVRELMQRPAIARRLKALYDTLEIATTTHPQSLLGMFDAQRKLWDSLGNSNQTGKGGPTHA